MKCLKCAAVGCFLLGAIAAGATPVDIVVVFVDHWEPGSGRDTPQQIQDWCDAYRTFADRHRDADGRPLRHSFFYWNYENGVPWTPPDSAMCLPVLQLAYDGYGEVDLHLHHFETGTPDENRERFVSAANTFITDCRRWGMFTTAEPVPRTRFAFIHGMWALDNSRLVGTGDLLHREFCGVNTELDALLELGCFADFTFPCHNVMDPLVQNRILYARDDASPWSYGDSTNVYPVSSGMPLSDDLMIFQGPRTPMPSSQGLGLMTPGSFDAWVATAIHVAGRLDRIFIKLHTHGVQQARVGVRSAVSEGTSTLWGDQAEAFWSYVESRYNDGHRYRVHYMSAREAYNVVRATQDGLKGNPYLFRDYAVAPYASSLVQTSGGYAMESWKSGEVVLSRQTPAEAAMIAIHGAWATPIVEESDDGIGWAPTDGNVSVGDNDGLALIDSTAAQYYRFVDLGPYGFNSSEFLPGPDGLTPGAPNPFRQRVKFNYRLGSPSPLRIEIFDIRGRRICTLVEDAANFGEGFTTWDGRDSRGRVVPAGLYICRMITRQTVAEQRIVFLR